MRVSPPDHFFRPTNIAEEKKERSKDVNVSKIINVSGVLPWLCYYEDESFERNGKKIVCDCFGGIVIVCK